MSKKAAILIGACFLLSIGVVAILVAASRSLRQRPGSFLREFPSHPVMEAEVLDLGYNSYYIAGGTDHNIYLGNYTAPLHLIVASKTLLDTQHVKLNVKGIMGQKFWALKIKVDSPHFYLTDGVIPVIYRGNVHGWTAERYAYDNSYFQDIVPISDHSFFIRALGKPVRENILGKITSTEPHVQLKHDVLQKQVDGIFCTDGMMHYNRDQNELVYLYRYRNEYIVMDTNVNILRRQHTLDTVTHAKITVAKITSSGSTTFASPPLMVNKQSGVWNNSLFVNSNLIAKNEHLKAHDRAAVIDVYSLRTGKYNFSFYIFDYQGKEKLREFSVFDGRLYAVFYSHIQVFNLKTGIFRIDR